MVKHCSNLLFSPHSRWSRTPLSWSVFNNHLGAVELLLTHNADAECNYGAGRSRPQRAHLLRTNNSWSTTVQLAVQVGCRKNKDLSVLAALVRSGKVDLNGHDTAQQTALHTAVLLGSEEAVRLLLEDGRADADCKDQDGHTARDLAVAAKMDNLVALFDLCAIQTQVAAASDTVTAVAKDDVDDDDDDDNVVNDINPPKPEKGKGATFNKHSKQACFKYNSLEGCVFAKCKFGHFCSLCGVGHEHSASNSAHHPVA